MLKCPRCHIQQDESPECQYCGLNFKEFMESAQASKTASSKRTVLFATILIVAGALLASYWIISFRHKTSEQSTIVAGSSAGEPRTKKNDLMTTAKELSGDAGIIKSLTGGSTKGSIIAMVLFSVVGMGYFAYGKKSQKLLMVICGIALMGYSYFVNGTVYIVLVGAGLSALPFVLGRK
jgi:hypothetical protein